MDSRRIHSSEAVVNLDSPLYIVILVCFVGTVAYLTAKIGGTMMLRPQMVWPLWPGCAFLVGVLLTTPRKTWPATIVAGFAGFVLYDLEVGLTTRTIILLILSDTIEVLAAQFGCELRIWRYSSPE
jgi:integral membrane sensor domain MASE1